MDTTMMTQDRISESLTSAFQVAELQRAKVELKLHAAYLQSLLDSSPGATVVLNNEAQVMKINLEFSRLFGFSAEEASGKGLCDLIVSTSQHSTAPESSSVVLASRAVSQSTTRRTKQGSAVEVLLNSFPIELEGERVGVIAQYYETKGRYLDRRVATTRDNESIYFDHLTGLPDRFLFEDRLHQAIAQSDRTGEGIALHYLDLDDFKHVNNTMGHRAGDELVRMVAQRLVEIVRPTDTVARLGGDEFAILQIGGAEPTGATALARKVLEALAKPYQVNGTDVHTSTTIGIALCCDSPGGTEQLMRDADTALHSAKQEGKNTFRFHNQKMADEVQSYVELRAELHGALQRGEFFLEYQPLFDLKSGRIVSLEALVRWQHPERGLLAPSEFLPVTESSGLIVPLGSWVLWEACLQRQDWSNSGLEEIPVSVNLSPVQFQDPKFATKLLNLMDGIGLDPCLLHLEITENLLMECSESLLTSIAELEARGIRFCIDDFGTGFASLRSLRAFSFHKIKIAQEFVQGVSDNPEDAAIVETVVDLGRRMGLRVVAEGVESNDQADFLRERDCDEVQGFLFSRPLAADDVTRLLIKQAAY